MMYEVTLTLKGPIRQKATKAIFDLLKADLEKLAKHYSLSLVCELHLDGVPHYHGLVRLSDLKVRSSFCDAVRAIKHIGRFTCNQVQYEESYRAYMVKDIPKTTLILGCSPIISNYHNLTVDEFI